MFKNTKEKRDPMEKAKQHLKDNFNKVIREKELVIECINDLIAEVENPLMSLLTEDDRVKFLNNYHEINQQLETCLEKFFSIQIILSDYEEKMKDSECSKNGCFSNLTSSDYVKNETENQLSDQDNQNISVQSETIVDGMNSVPVITIPVQISNEASSDILICPALPEKTFNNNELSFEMMINNSSEMITEASEITKINSSDVTVNVAKQKFQDISDIVPQSITLPKISSIENKNVENVNRNQYNNLSNFHEQHKNYSEYELNEMSIVTKTHNLLTNEETCTCFANKSDDKNTEKCFIHSSVSSSIPLLSSLDSVMGNDDCEISVQTNNYNHESLHSNKENLQTSIQNFQKLFHLNVTNEESLKNIVIDIPCCDIPLNETIPVNITYVENLSNFWLQPNIKQFNELLVHLQSFEENKYECTIGGKYFLAPYTKDNLLHRVKKLEYSSDKTVLVHYIDYGDRDAIPVSFLRPLPSFLSSIPSQAVLCFLDDIQPEEWILQFFKLLVLNQPLFAIISSPVEGKYPVKLFIKSAQKNDPSFEMIDIIQYMLDQTKSELPSNVHKEILDSGNNTSNESVMSSTSDFYQTSEADKMKENENKHHTNHTLISDTKESNVLPKEAFLITMENEMLEINYNCPENWTVIVPEPILEFIKDNTMIVMMSFIISPSEFYVNVASQHCYMLDELEARMNIFYNAYAIKHMMNNNKEDKLINSGTFCSCKSNEDGKWYRARILETINETKEIDEVNNLSCSAIVQYIDYGNKENVPRKNILPLLPEFAKFPALSVYCSLADIEPVEVENNNVNKWPKETIERFYELTGFKHPFHAQIKPFEENQNRFPLKIYILQSETKFINYILVEEGLALGVGIFLNFNNETKNEEIIENWDPMAADFLSERNSYKVDIDDPGVALTCYKAKDEKYVCKFFARDGKCFRGDHCPFKHIISKDETTLDKENVYSCDIDLEIPDMGKLVLVQISAVFNPSHFYIIFPYGPASVDEIIFFEQDCESFNLESFINDMNIFYSKKRTSRDMTYEPLGKIVAAKSNLNGLWYRGRILNINETENLYEIFFVDFGNCEWINKKNVEDIDDKFMEFPFQAIECHLANVNINNWKQNKYLQKQTWSLFRNLTEEKILVALILAKQDSILYINLYTLDGIMLNKEFTDRGLFQYTSELI